MTSKAPGAYGAASDDAQLTDEVVIGPADRFRLQVIHIWKKTMRD
jgi:hypothetical protein